MDFKKINELILNNKKEIERLKNSENNADKDRVAYLTDENKKLEEFKTNYQKKAEQLINLESADKKDNKQIKKLRNEMKEDVKKVEKASQGKLRNVFSALIGQVDKKVHNWWYREGKDKRWESHVAKVNDRYKNVPKYLLRNTGISAGMFLGMGAVVFLFPATSAVLTPIIFGATATFITQTAIKAGVAIYNNTKFGGPLLERTKKLFKGNYQENVQNALYERKASRNIFDRVKEVSYKLVGKKVNTTSESNVEPQEEKTNDKEDKKENNLNLSEEVKNAIEVIKNVNLETATLEELQSIIEWTKDVIKDLPDNYKAEYNKIFARYQMLLDEENKKKNNSNKNDDKAKSNDDRISRINKMIMDFDLKDNDLNDYYSIINLVGKYGDKLDKMALDKYNDIYEKAQMLYNEQKKKESVQKPNIDNYANLDRFNVVDIKKKNDGLTFAKAISIVRDKNIHSQDEWEMAMNKLASVFGSNKNKTTSDISKVLNDFNKTEKLIAEYGRKLRSGNATGEDKLTHQALLYHLAKYDVIDNFSFDTLEEDINDFIADEAKRYTEDLREFEENNRKSR